MYMPACHRLVRTICCISGCIIDKKFTYKQLLITLSTNLLLVKLQPGLRSDGLNAHKTGASDRDTQPTAQPRPRATLRPASKRKF